jgi:hypothetical protein
MLGPRYPIDKTISSINKIPVAGGNFCPHGICLLPNCRKLKSRVVISLKRRICHSERSEARFSIARFLCDESAFRLHAEDKADSSGPAQRAALGMTGGATTFSI